MLPWEPSGFGQAFPLALLSTVCWGSWSNASKTADKLKVPFPFVSSRRHSERLVPHARRTLTASPPCAAHRLAPAAAHRLTPAAAHRLAPAAAHPRPRRVAVQFYFEYALSLFLTSVFFLQTVGGGHITAVGACLPVGSGSCTSIAFSGAKVAAALGAGVVFNVANLLLVVAFTLAGLAVAFPLVIGTALVVGTSTTYAIDPTGRPALLFSGVLLALLAVLASARSHQLLEAHRAADEGGKRGGEGAEEALVGPGGGGGEEASSSSSGGGGRSRNVVALCVAAGVLMGTWSPLVAYAQQGGAGQLTPYGEFLFFSLAALLTTPPLLMLQQADVLIPRTGPRIALSASACWGTAPGFGWGAVGGFVWSTGTLANAVAGNEIGFALSYALGQSAPMVGVLWGLLYYGEYDGAPPSSRRALGAMFALYAGAIALMAVGGS